MHSCIFTDYAVIMNHKWVNHKCLLMQWFLLLQHSGLLLSDLHIYSCRSLSFCRSAPRQSRSSMNPTLREREGGGTAINTTSSHSTKHNSYSIMDDTFYNICEKIHKISYIYCNFLDKTCISRMYFHCMAKPPLAVQHWIVCIVGCVVDPTSCWWLSGECSLLKAHNRFTNSNTTKKRACLVNGPLTRKWLWQLMRVLLTWSLLPAAT